MVRISSTFPVVILVAASSLSAYPEPEWYGSDTSDHTVSEDDIEDFLEGLQKIELSPLNKQKLDLNNHITESNIKWKPAYVHSEYDNQNLQEDVRYHDSSGIQLQINIGDAGLLNGLLSSKGYKRTAESLKANKRSEGYHKSIQNILDDLVYSDTLVSTEEEDWVPRDASSIYEKKLLPEPYEETYPPDEHQTLHKMLEDLQYYDSPKRQAEYVGSESLIPDMHLVNTNKVIPESLDVEVDYKPLKNSKISALHDCELPKVLKQSMYAMLSSRYPLLSQSQAIGSSLPLSDDDFLPIALYDEHVINEQPYRIRSIIWDFVNMFNEMEVPREVQDGYAVQAMIILLSIVGKTLQIEEELIKPMENLFEVQKKVLRGPESASLKFEFPGYLTEHLLSEAGNNMDEELSMDNNELPQGVGKLQYVDFSSVHRDISTSISDNFIDPVYNTEETPYPLTRRVRQALDPHRPYPPWRQFSKDEIREGRVNQISTQETEEIQEEEKVVRRYNGNMRQRILSALRRFRNSRRNSKYPENSSRAEDKRVSGQLRRILNKARPWRYRGDINAWRDSIRKVLRGRNPWRLRDNVYFQKLYDIFRRRGASRMNDSENDEFQEYQRQRDYK